MLFLENKDHENPRACIRIPGTRMHVGVPETMKGMFSALKFAFWNESHIFWEPFQTPPPLFLTRKIHT